MRTRIDVLMLIAMIGAVGAVAVAGPISDPVKWSQPPMYLNEIDPAAPRDLIYGWDEVSIVPGPIVADDFPCDDPRPVTDLHWWGSYPDIQPGTAPRHPDGFLIHFWKNVPPNTIDKMPWSHPAEPPIWTIECFNYKVSPEPVGIDIDVATYQRNGEIIPVDECFQFNQKLRPEEYFRQEPGNIYWVSIQAIYRDLPDYRWGWKTTRHYFEDDAVTGWEMADGTGIFWEEIRGPSGDTWDMAFELTVPEPGTMLLLATGGVLAVLRRRRRR
jgi:hypothetical protein